MNFLSWDFHFNKEKIHMISSIVKRSLYNLAPNLNDFYILIMPWDLHGFRHFQLPFQIFYLFLRFFLWYFHIL